MTRSFKNLWPVAALALLAACGGGGGNAALSKTFNYGASQAPSTAEQSAATSAQASLSDATSFSATPDATKGSSVVVFADVMAAAALGGTGIAAQAPASPNALRSAIHAAATQACTTVTADTVTFNSCSDSSTGFTITLNGHITSKAGTVSWDVNGSFSGTSNNVNININVHQEGTFTVTSTTLKGHAGTTLGGSVSAQGQSASFGVAQAAVVDLTYQSSPQYCVTNGSLEVKRVWTERPQGATSAQLPDVAVKMTWTGCNTLQVAHSS
jgi:hypothetical protein